MDLQTCISRWPMRYGLCLFLLFGTCSGVWAESAILLFQDALIREKALGDLAAAAKGYRAVLDLYREGRVDTRLALRARKRLDLLKGRFDLEMDQDVSVDESGLPKLETDRTTQELQALREAFGIEALLPGVELGRQIGPVQPVWALARRIQAIGALDSAGPSKRLDRTNRKRDPVEDFGRRMVRLKEALGLGGLAEYYAVWYKKKHRSRPMQPVDFYWAGLMAEKDRGDFEAALGFYQRALAQVHLSPQLERQIRHRLDFCTRWLTLE